MAGHRGTLHRALLAALLGLAAATGASAAVYDAAWHWRTISTAHFHVHYHDGLEEPAAELARIAEEVHGPMVEIVGWTPREPTEVTLVDQTDLANGLTTVLPYNQIVIYPVRPGLAQSIGDYGGWLRTVFVHEYAHVLGLDPVRGYSAVLRKIFGKVGYPLTPVGALAWFFAAPPNIFLPPWFHEGLATDLETDLTGRGRKGSTYYRMIYRTDVAEDAIPPLDRLGGDFPQWPSFATRYIYGARLLQVVEDRLGPEALGRLVRGHAGRFPYAIDRPPARVAGAPYQGLYREMVARLEAEYRPEIDALRRAGLTPSRPLTTSGFATTGPTWLDARTLVYTRADATRPPALVRLDLATGAERELALRPGGRGRPTRLEDGRVAFSRVEVSRPWAGGLLYSDLYACDADGGDRERLSHSARILEADYSARAGFFAAVEVEDSRHRLVLLSPDDPDRAPRVLLAEPGARYDGPRWSPDGTRIAFSRKTDPGYARLAVLDVRTGEVRLVTPEGSQAGFPTWSPDGKRVAFAWDRTDVFDLYAYDLEAGSVRRLTRVLGGAFDPAWSPDGDRLAFARYSSRGFDMALLDLADAVGEPVRLPPPEVLPAAETDVPAAPPPSPAPGAPYSPWPRVLPTFWLPDAFSDHAGGAVGAWTVGHDPLLRHRYYLSGYWAGGSHRFYGQGIYQNDVSYPTLSVQAFKLPVLHADLFETPAGDWDYWEEDRGVRFEARLDLPRALRRWSVAVAWAWEEVARLSRTGEDLDGRDDLAALPFRGRVNPLSLSLLYDSAFPYDNRFTVGAERGTRLEGTYRLRHEVLGAELNEQEVLGDWHHFVPVPRLDHTVVALRAKGGLGWGDVPFQSIFQVGGVAGEFPIRGYPNRVDRGERAAIGSVELRFPVWSPFRGIWDWPVFLGRLHVAAFGDAGRTWQGGDDEWRRGAGAELRVDTVLGYYLPTTFVLGVAHGFDEDGGGRAYATFTGAY